MSLELVSIVIAAYNAEQYIAETIESCINQTYKNIEIIIVNDGSIDRTPEIIEEYAKKDARIKVIHQENKGEGATRNVGNEAARGSLVAVMDADDIMLPNRIEEEVNYMMQHPELDLVSCWMQYINEAGKNIGVYVHPDDMTTPAQFENYIKKNRPYVLGHPGVLYKKDKVLAVGGYRDIRPGTDTDLWNRMGENGCKIAVIPKILVKYRIYYGAVNTSTTFESFYNYYWLQTNSDRRKQKLPELSKAEYIQELKNKPFWDKVYLKRHIYSLYFSRKFSVAWGNRYYLHGFYFLTVAALLSPFNMLKKLITKFKFHIKR